MFRLVKHEAILADKLKDPKFRRAYEEERVLAKLAVEIAELRLSRGLSQAALAKRLKTTQQTVSRWEKNNYGNIEVRSLEKIAKVFGATLSITLKKSYKAHARL